MKPINFREPFAWLIVIALLFFILWQRSEGKRKDMERFQGNRLNEMQIENLTAVAKRAGHRADSITTSFENRHAKDSIDLRALSVRNRAMSENVQKLKKPVQVLIDTLQPLRELIIAYDSLLAGKDTIISHLTLSHEADIVDLEAIIKAREDQILVEATKGHLWEEVAVKTEKDYNKERRKKGRWRTVAAILAGGVLFLTISK